MEAHERTTSVLLGIASIGLGILTLISSAARPLAGMGLIIALLFTFTHLRVSAIDSKLRSIDSLEKHLQTQIARVTKEFNLHKKLYKLEQHIISLEKMLRNKRGKFDPMWGGVIVIFIILILAILKALGIY